MNAQREESDGKRLAFSPYVCALPLTVSKEKNDNSILTDPFNCNLPMLGNWVV